MRPGPKYCATAASRTWRCSFSAKTGTSFFLLPEGVPRLSREPSFLFKSCRSLTWCKPYPCSLTEKRFPPGRPGTCCWRRPQPASLTRKFRCAATRTWTRRCGWPRAPFPPGGKPPVVERARVLFRYRQILESETEAVATRGLPRPRQDPFGCPGRSAAGHRGGGIRLRHALADPGSDRGGSGARD